MVVVISCSTLSSIQAVFVLIVLPLSPARARFADFTVAERREVLPGATAAAYGSDSMKDDQEELLRPH